MQDYWRVLCIDPFLPEDRRSRYDIIHSEKEITLPFPVLCLYQHFGGQMQDCHFMCKLPEDVLTLAKTVCPTDPTAVMATTTEVLGAYEEVKKSSRPKALIQMARALEKRWSVVTQLSPVIARGILRDVAGYDIVGLDARSANDKKKRLARDRTMDDRLAALVDTHDPEIIVDGRSISSRASEGTTHFDEFWDAVERVMVSEEAAVVDERRHNAADSSSGRIVLQRSTNVSFRDIYERASALVPPNAQIPSQRWMEFQFWPKDASLRSAVNYTGRFKVSMASQTGQLRKSHPDQLVGHVEFKYLKELAVRKRHSADMLCGDDKHKVSYDFHPCISLVHARTRTHSHTHTFTHMHVVSLSCLCIHR